MSGTPRPLPGPDPDTAPYWEACRSHELRVQRCGACEAFRFYPGPVCPACASSESRWECVTGRGEVYSYVVVHRAMHPAFAGDVPYAVALVELEGTGGIRLPSRLVDCPPEEVRIGMAVEVCFENASDAVTLPVFRPAEVEQRDRPSEPRGGESDV
ncbi:MAG: Zn-ribbon domain-containing OB-fold protein [Myxococcota bacterium]